ncbi:MAG: cytochrome D1 domain-containing protein [Gammaproteobacteria bacterium]
MKRARLVRTSFHIAAVALVLSAATSIHAAVDHTGLYATHCAACHGADRLGGTGPALLPGNLKRLRKPAAIEAVTIGRPATQMPEFADKLDTTQIQALVDFIYTPPDSTPHWGATEISASRAVHRRPETLDSTPDFAADPLNLFVVVEVGDHHATILDGDRLEVIHRFPTRFALHGGPKYSPDGRFVFFGSRDGWVSKYDLYNLSLIAEIRAGINMRNIAVSGDGRYVMAANYLPHTLVLLDAGTLELIKVIPAADRSGASSRVSAVYAAPPRGSFIVALKDVPEVWEVSYDDNASGNRSDRAHNYTAELTNKEQAGQFPIRRIALQEILDDFFFDQDYRLVIGAARDGGGQVVDLDAARKLASLALPGLPHLGSGITWEYKGRNVLATPNLKAGAVSIIDMETWETVRKLETLGPGFFMRSHENSPYAWVDVFFGPHRDAVHVIDKNTLDIVKTLRPAPGKTAAHVEFTRDGRHALLSVWDMDGAIVVYDSHSLKEIKRLPMKKPSGKYNVWNKISGSRGTSH